MKTHKYYDGTKLLSLKDLDGLTPEIFVCTSNRSAGKTTFFNSMVVRRFLKRGEKFCVLYRYRDEISDCHNKFFGDIKNLFFPEHTMSSKIMGKGLYAELYLDDASCGYCIPLNSADKIKKISHVFYDVTSILFDEFQTESGIYCPGEISKFLSIHRSLARGGGAQVRYLPVYMLGNFVSVINPYYLEWGFSDRLNESVKFMRGHGVVMEQGFNEEASKASLQSGVSRAFSNNQYMQYAAQKIYLNDHDAFIEKKDGFSKYLCTILAGGREYGIRYYNDGILYCSKSVDTSYPVRYSVSSDDHTPGAQMITASHFIIRMFRENFRRGSFRFQNQECKTAVMDALRFTI